MEGADALGLLKGIDELVVARGRRTERYDLRKGRPSDEELLALLLGRSGKLRAPSMKVGRRFLVGFNQEMLEAELL